MKALAIIEAAAQSLMFDPTEFGKNYLSEEEAAEWLCLIANTDLYLSLHYSDRDEKWYPCLRS